MKIVLLLQLEQIISNLKFNKYIKINNKNYLNKKLKRKWLNI